MGVANSVTAARILSSPFLVSVSSYTLAEGSLTFFLRTLGPLSSFLYDLAELNWLIFLLI